MSEILDRIRSHYAAQPRREIHVPEWDLTIFCTPLNVQQRSSLFQASRGDSLEYQVEAIIMKATDADGNKLFGPHDRLPLMMQADPFVVERVAAQIVAQDLKLDPNEEVEEAKKP